MYNLKDRMNALPFEVLESSHLIGLGNHLTYRVKESTIRHLLISDFNCVSKFSSKTENDILLSVILLLYVK